MGDFNAKIGNDNIGVERTIGTHGIGQLNQNGERLLELCQVSDLCISNTTFQHKDIHKVTWNSPDDRTKNQIDHICINNKYRSFIQDVRAYRGADIGSDHNLCIAKLKAKLKCRKTNKIAQKINSQRLRNVDMRQKFGIALQNRFQPLENLPGDNEETFLNTENKWLRLKTCIKEAAIETVGYLTKQSKKWLTEETWKSIDRRKELKVKLLSATSEEVYKNIKTEYQNADKNRKKVSKTRQT